MKFRNLYLTLGQKVLVVFHDNITHTQKAYLGQVLSMRETTTETSKGTSYDQEVEVNHGDWICSTDHETELVDATYLQPVLDAFEKVTPKPEVLNPPDGIVVDQPISVPEDRNVTPPDGHKVTAPSVDFCDYPSLNSSETFRVYSTGLVQTFPF